MRTSPRPQSGISAILALAVLVLAAGWSYPAPDSFPQYVSEYGMNRYNSVCVEGHHAYYYSASAGIDIFDVSDPSRPLKTGRYDCRSYCPIDMVVRSGIAFCPVFHSLDIVDVTDDTTPRLVSRVPSAMYVSVTSFAMKDNLAFLCEYEKFSAQGSLKVFDMANFRSPILRGSVSFPGYSMGIAVQGDFVYLGAPTSSQLFVVQVTSPDAPRLVSTIPMDFGPNVVRICGDHLYALTDNFMIIFDLQVPSSPVEVCRIYSSSRPTDIQFRYPYAFWTKDAGGSFDGLEILDISNPAHPLPVGQAAKDTPLGGLALAGDLAFTCENWGFPLVFDAADPATLRITAEIKEPRPLKYLATYEDLAFALDENHEFVVYDIATPESPVFLGKCTLPFAPFHIFVFPPEVYVLDCNDKAYAIDVSDPASPALIGAVENCNIFCGSMIYVKDSFLFTEERPGFAIWTKNSATSFTRLATGNRDDIPSTMEVVDGLAYMTGELLTVTDVHDPANPVLLGSSEERDCDGQVEVLNGRAYVGGWSGLFVFDVSSPSHPYLVMKDTFHDRNKPRFFGEENGRLIVVHDGDNGGSGSNLEVLGLDDPDHPTQIAEISYFGDISDMCLVGSQALLAGAWGLASIDLSHPRELPSIAELSNNTDFHHLAVREPFVYAATHLGLDVIDYSNRAFPRRASFSSLSEGNTAIFPTGIALAGRYAVVGVEKADAAFFDVSDPFRPVPAAVDPAIYSVRAVAARGNTLYVWAGWDSQALYVVDVSGPSPRIVGTYVYNGGAGRRWDVAVPGSMQISEDGKTVFVIQLGTVIALDVSDPAHTTLAGSFKDSRLGSAVVSAIDRFLLYVSSDDNTVIWVINTADPSSLRLVSGFALSENDSDYYNDHDTLPCRALWKVGNTLYAAIDKYAYGFAAIDYTDVTAPKYISYFETSSRGICGCKSGDFQYWATTEPAKIILMQNGLSGDLDGNSAVNAADLAILWGYLSGTIGRGGPSKPFPEHLADINKDGVVNVLDGLKLQHLLAVL